MELDEISRRIDEGENPGAIRIALGEKILQCLIARGEVLTPWERVNFGLAIDLLHSHMLRITWTHVDFVCAVSDEIVRNRQLPESQPVPTLRALHDKLIIEIDKIYEEQLTESSPNTHGDPPLMA